MELQPKRVAQTPDLQGIDVRFDASLVEHLTRRDPPAPLRRL
jgi:hypothetical protein